MSTMVDNVRPLESFPVDLDLIDEYLDKSDGKDKETPDNRAEKIQEMLQLLNDYPDIMTRTDDAYLLRFLRAKYFIPKYAFNLLKNYEEFKIKHHETWNTVSFPILKRLTCNSVVQVLPCRDQYGRRIFWMRGGLWKSTDCSMEYLLQAGGLCGDATIVEPMTQVAGIVMIFDLKDVGMAHIKGLTPAFAKRMTHFLANCLPVRINALHVVNEPSIFSMILAVFKTFMTDRMKKRLFFHGSNMGSLHDHVTPKSLPAELGGSFGDVDPVEWYKVLTGDLVLKELKSIGYKFTEEDLAN